MTEADAHETGGAQTGNNGEAPDHEWFVLTEGMEPYEKFRFIARHVLETALDEARDYVDDERIFEDLSDGDDETVEAHLKRLDTELREDETLSSLEREFLCAAVSAVMRDHDLEARCFGELIRFAGKLDDRGPVGGCGARE